MKIGNHAFDNMLRQLIAEQPFPSERKDYLEPFRDYPSYHLQDASPEEAASFIVGYVCGHVKYSPGIQLLTEENDKAETTRLLMSLNVIRTRIANEIGLEINSGKVCILRQGDRSRINVEQFLRLTDIVAAERIENCGGMCLVGARALKEFGCPHPVTVMNVHARLASGEKGDHAMIRIGDGPGAWIADPYMHHLNEPQRLKLLGFDCPSFWPAFDFEGKGNAARYLHLTFYPDDRHDSPVVRLRRYDELLQTDSSGKPIHESVVFDAFEVDRTPDGEITFRVAQ
ncbi:hypothetical protein BOSP111201_04420 [Bordetella sputigena]|uniref:hypothetical protein n=1 Tax=Bordetella sputigena TaxID=1416810 RepID=UPI0039F04909